LITDDINLRESVTDDSSTTEKLSFSLNKEKTLRILKYCNKTLLEEKDHSVFFH